MPVRSTTYYHDTIIFLVENTLYKVSRDYFVHHSAVFRDMFSIPQAEGQVREGSSDEHPLLLEGIKAKDFESFLELAFPPGIYNNALPRSTSSGPIAIMTPEDIEREQKNNMNRYSPCLELSQRWGFHHIHAKCIKRVNKRRVGSVVKLALGKQHHIPEWIREGCLELVQRSQQLTKEEAERIGAMSTVMVCNLRERVAALQLQKERTSISAAIEKGFKDELAFAEKMYNEFYADYLKPRLTQMR